MKPFNLPTFQSAKVFFFFVLTIRAFDMFLFCSLFSSNPSYLHTPAKDFWGSVPGVSRASVSFGASFGLESLLSSEPTKPVSMATQAKLIILVRCLAEQVRQG